MLLIKQDLGEELTPFLRSGLFQVFWGVVVSSCSSVKTNTSKPWKPRSGPEFWLWVSWHCLDQVWRADMGAPLPPWALPEPWLPWAVGQGLIRGALQEVPWEQLWNHSVMVWSMRNTKIPFLHSLCSVLLLHLKSSQFFREHQLD